MKDLREMTSKELKEIAKEMKISNWWNLKKTVLIEKIEEIQNMTDEEKQAIADRKAKEDAALSEYKKHWRHYTKTYNPVEFIGKWRSGEIVLENEDSIEEPIEEETEEVTPKDNELPEASEEEKEDQPEETPEPKTEEKPAEKPKPKRGALIEFDGRSQNICAWGEELGISANTLYGRIYKMNWSVERAFTTPARKSK